MRRPAANLHEPAADRPTRADALKDAIAQAILQGDIRPGQRLDEVSVAHRFAVSRTPVREALKQLAAMELVAIRPHRGAVVAGLEPARLVELFEAMAEIEAACARLAASRMDGVDRLRLEEAFSTCDQALQDGAIERIHVANQLFHDAIHVGARNPFLADAARLLRRKLAPLSRVQFGVTGRPDASAAEHRAIMTALRACDVAGADRSTRRHIASVRACFDRWLERDGPRVRPE